MLDGSGWILVTGGAGFIGGHIAEKLLREGLQVRIFDNFSTGSRRTVEQLARLGSGKLEVVEADVRDEHALRSAMSGTTHVAHQAALPSVQRSIEQPGTTHDVNATGTLHLLEAARDEKVRRLVFAGSSSVYGDQGELPKREAMPPMPKSPYALSKQIGEAYCTLFSDLYDLPTLTLRYFNVFGPRQQPDSQYAAVIPLFIRALLVGEAPQVYGDGEQTRDFTYISNVVDANLLALQGKGPNGGVLNVACGARTSLLELLGHLEAITGRRIPPEFRPARRGDVRHSEAAIDEAIHQLGFEPRVGLREGLEKTVAWTRSEGEG